MAGAALLLLGGMTLLPACDKRPDNVLPEKEMIDLLADMQLAEAYLRTSGPEVSDSMREAFPEAVLARHGVTYAEVDTTLAYYGRNADDYFALYDKVNKELTARRKKIDGNITVSDRAADNIWPYQMMTMFAAGNATDGLIFSIKPDGITPGERLEWSMRISTQTAADGLLGVDYEDGSGTYIRRRLNGTRNISLQLQTDTGKNVTRVYGRFTVDRTRLPLWADSIVLTHAPLDSALYGNIYQQSRHYGLRKKNKKDIEPKDSVLPTEGRMQPAPAHTLRPGG